MYRRILVAFLLVLLAGTAVPARTQTSAVRYTTRVVRAAGQTFHCNVVIINLSSGKVVPRVVTASSGIGRTEDFGSMVRRMRAVAGINGSFFEAYLPVGDKDPDMTLIRNGQVIHKGSIGTVVGFTFSRPLMARLELPVRGTIEIPGRRQIVPWYAYWLNRTPTSPNNITIFTPARGAKTRVSDGVSVIVSNNTVRAVVRGEASIPPLGYVIHFRGTEEREAGKFVIGAKVGYRVIVQADRDNEAWQAVAEAVGAGPRLLTDGHVTVDALSEGFQDPKILTNHGLRSAIGFTRDGKILLVTVGGPTVRELAEVMRGLGAYQAMNLDGGASSGLYCNGSLITRPGRLLSNALVFTRP